MHADPLCEKLFVRPFEQSDQEAVIELWKRSGLVVPQNDPAGDIAKKMQVQPELFLVGLLDGRIVATVMAGYEGHRGWINYLAVDSKLRLRGFGRRMMVAAEGKLLRLGCPKINLQVRETNPEAIDFYHRLGFTNDEVVSLGKRLIEAHGE